MMADAHISLGAAASRGAAVTVGAQLVRLGLQVATVVILARLLTPEDYGLVAMILAIVGIGDIVREFGLGQAAVQAKSLSTDERSNLFWVNTLIGLALTLAAMALSGVVAAVYGRPELQPLTLALGTTFLLRGLSAQYTADLTRSMRFGQLSAAEITGQAVALGVAIVLGMLGWGAWALAWQQIAQACVVLVLCVVLAGWLPRGYRRHVPIRPFVRFGAALAASHLLNYASRNVDAVVIGIRFGAHPLGLYNRAFQLMSMPLTQLQAPATRVALPVLSRLQDSRTRFAQFILTGQFAMLLVIGVVSSVCVSQADELIAVALGGDWLGSAPLLRILAIGGIFQTATYASYWVFLAKGLVRQNLLYALVTRPLAIVVIALGSMWGIEGVAWAYTLTLGLFWPVSLIWLARVSDAPTGRMFVTGVRCLAVVGVTTAVVAFATDALLADHPLGSLLAGIGLTLALTAVAAIAVPGFRGQVRETLALRRFFRRGAARTSSGASEPARPDAREREAR